VPAVAAQDKRCTSAPTSTPTGAYARRCTSVRPVSCVPRRTGISFRCRS